MYRWIAGVLLLVFATVPAIAEDARTAQPPLVALEIAPRELGQASGTGDMLLTIAPGGKEIWLFDQAERAASRFSEQGDSWGDAVRLSMTNPLQDSLRVSRFSTDGSSLAFSGPEGIYTFTADGRFRRHLRIFQPGDIIAGRGSTWLVSLINLPHPAMPGRYLARKQFGDNVPRLVLLSDSDLKVGESGLYESEELSASAGAARRLRMARAGDRFYAAEHASYRVYELNKKLKVSGLFRDPALTFEKDRGGVVSVPESTAPGIPDPLPGALANRGQDATQPGTSAGRIQEKVQMKIAAEPVIRDISWDSSSQRLLILLGRDTVAERFYSLDALDPLAGEVLRVRLTLPKGEEEISLTQLSAGARYIWLRGYKGDTPTLRLDKLALLDGLLVKLPQVAEPTESGEATEEPGSEKIQRGTSAEMDARP